MPKGWFDVLRPGTPFPYDILNKEGLTRDHITYMLNRTNQMFEWKNLPEEIPDYVLESYLQIGGVCAIARNPKDGKLYVLLGERGGPPSPTYQPTLWVGANPALEWSYSLKIDEECVVVRSDTHMIGLLPLFNRYATMMTENEVSIRSAQINSRQQVIIYAADESEMESADLYLNNLIAGKLGAVGLQSFLEGTRVQNAGSSHPNTIIQLIELEQYLKASWYNELGLNNSFSMKREYVSAEEIASNDDILLPMVDDMLKWRKTACEQINAMFGTSISVDKNSSWKNKEEEAEAHIGTEEGNEAASVDTGEEEN